MTLNAPERDGNRGRGQWVWLSLILLLALALRLIRLGTFPYWHDEVHNLVASENLFALIFHGDLISNHPPGPYILVALWRAMGLGGNEWTMRLLPALFGVGGVAAIFALARRLFGERAGLWSALLLAISPLQLHHSQDLKEYIYLPCVAAVMGLWFYKAMDSNRMRDWLLYGLLAGIACYTEIFVGPLLVAINVWAVYQMKGRPGLWKGWLAGNALGALMFLPWLGIMVRKAANTMIYSPNFWVPPPSLFGVGFYFKAVAFGYTAITPWFRIAALLYLVLVIAGFIQAYRVNRKGAALLAMWAIVPVAMVYTVSLFTQSIFLIRAMLPYAIALYIFAGVFLAGLRPRWFQLGVAGLVCMVVSDGLYHEYRRDYPPIDYPHRPGTHPPRDYSGAAKYVLAHWQEGDVILHSADSTWLPFYWYGFRGMPSYFGGLGAQFINEILSGNPKNNNDSQFDNYWPQEPQNIARNAKRVWFVYSEWERKYLVGNATHLYRWMDAHFTEVDNHAFLGIDLFLYVPQESAAPIARDEDDGVSAVVTLGGTRKGPYRKTLPDSEVVARPVEARRGRLTLAFDQEAQGALIRLAAAGRRTRTVGFKVENHAAQAAELRIECIPSDVLVDLASLFETDPKSEAWNVEPVYNPAPPPESYDLLSLAGNLAGGPASVAREVSLPPGDYSAYLYTMGLPGNIAFQRAPLDVRLGESPLVAPALSSRQSPLRWFWLKTNPVRIDHSPVPLRIEGERLPGSDKSWANVGYLALRRPEDGPSDGKPAWTTTYTLPVGATTHWTAEVDAEIGRVDVWVYDTAADGKGYRIFQRYHD